MDWKNVPTGGNLELGYETRFGKKLTNKVEVEGFADLISFQSATREYRLVNRYAIGLNAAYTNDSRIWGRKNTVTAGIRLKTEPERVEYYDNYGGQKGDLIEQLNSQAASKAAVFAADTFEVIPRKLSLLLDGRYQYEVYTIEEQTLPSRSDKRTFSHLTPELGLEYRPLEWLAVYAIANMGYKSPADIQLTSPDPFYLYNPTLIPQTSFNYQAGLKFRSEKETLDRFLLPSWHLNAAWYQSFIDNEIVPYEVFGDIFFRNAQKSVRYGIRLDGAIEIIKGLSLEASYVYSRFSYDKYQAIAIETDTTGNIVQVDRDFSGNACPGIPQNFIKASLGYEHSFGKKIGLLAKLSYTSVSSMWADDRNTEQTDVYGTADALVRCSMKFGHFRILATAGLNNLFDTKYAGWVNVNSANYRYYVAGAPFNFLCNLNLGYAF
jgi:iron complex outermembrane receptor protein